MKIKFDTAHIKFDLNKLLNEIDIVVDTEKVDTNTKNNKPKVESGVSNNTNVDSVVNNNAQGFVRGSSTVANNHGVLNVVSISTIALLAIATLKKEYLENLLPGNSNNNYILINTKTNKCEINTQNIFDYEVIVKTKENEILNLGKLTKFSIEELNEVIFVEIKDGKKQILEIKQEENKTWNKIANSKYYEVF